jgi:hypothetical protein
MYFIFLFLLTCLTGCACQPLAIRTEYLNREHLASYYVHTPDPQLDTPPIGQRLIVSWALPRAYLNYSDLHLNLIVRLKNHQEYRVQKPINSRRGFYVYPLLNQAFCTSGGIATYKAQIKGADLILDEWQHPLWEELITFPAESYDADQPADQIALPSKFQDLK